MTKREYSLDDVKDYLYEEYELVWKDFEIIENDLTCKVRDYDFFEDQLHVVAILYKSAKPLNKPLHVSNKTIQVGGYPKETEDWQDFLSNRKNKDLQI